MDGMQKFPAPAPTTAPDHLQRSEVIELPYLDAGRRVFVATDENGWMIAHGMGLSEEECERVVARLYSTLDQRKAPDRLRIIP